MVAVREARVRAAVVGSMLGKGAELLTLVLLATVVPRLLGPQRYGELSVPLTVVTLGSLALSLGGPTVMARFVPAAPVDERVDVARAIGARLARGRAVQLGGVALAAVAATVVAPDAFPAGRTALVVLGLTLSVAATLALQVPLGLGRTGPWTARYPLQNAALIVLVVLLRDVGDGTGVVAAITVSAGVAALFGALALRPVLHVPGRARVQVPADAIRFGSYHAIGAACAQVAQRGAVVALAVLGGSSQEVGHVALALGLALGVTYAVLQAFTVALPHLADGPGGSTADAVRTMTRLAAVLLGALALPLLLASVAAERWVPLVFGAEYDSAASTFGPALAVVALAPLNSLVVQLAALELRPRVTAAGGATAVAVWALGSVALAPAGGATGAVTATLIGTAASALVGVRLLGRLVDVRLVLASIAVAAAVVVGGAL